MFSTISTTIAKLVLSPLIGLMVIAGYPVGLPVPVQENLGATNAIESPVALFETSLQSSISDSATTMTLNNATTLDGSTLASSTYSFIIDEGTATQEFVIADCTATVCTNMTRGLSAITGTTSVDALKFGHRRGASVKITDAPVLIKLTRIINGVGTLPNPISYTSHPTFTATTQIVDKKYVDDTAFSGAGVIDATTAARGVVELATQLEAASSTTNGGSGVLVIPASSATSTYNSATADLRVVVTQNSGKIDNGFLNIANYTGTFSAATTTFTGNVSITNATSTFASSTPKLFTASGTWSKATSTLKYIVVEVVGGGGGGATVGGTEVGGGGGGGGYSRKTIQASLLGSSETVTVGAGGAADSGSGGTTSFGSHLSATGGTSATSFEGGAAGAGSSGDLNTEGGDGTSGYGVANHAGGTGGSSYFGGGGRGGASNAQTGATGNNYGGGGGGGNQAAGAAGAAGVVFITEYHF